MEIFIFWLVFAFLVGIAASSRGRSGAGWFILAVIISPLLGILFVLVLPNLKHEALLNGPTEAALHWRFKPAVLPACRLHRITYHHFVEVIAPRTFKSPQIGVGGTKFECGPTSCGPGTWGNVAVR
jgi:hypothetical protein